MKYILCITALCSATNAFAAQILFIQNFDSGGRLIGTVEVQDVDDSGFIRGIQEIRDFEATYFSDSITFSFSDQGVIESTLFLNDAFWGNSGNTSDFQNDFLAVSTFFSDPLVNRSIDYTLGGVGSSICGIGLVCAELSFSGELVPETTVVSSEPIRIFGPISLAPGSFEGDPILPDSISSDGGFVFDFATGEIAAGNIFYIDPEIAIGYEYDVVGTMFDVVVAPLFETVPDADGYILSFSDSQGDQEVQLLPGEVFSFNEPISSFVITGIDPALMLDSLDTLAFATGLSVTDGATDGFQITQTPITATSEVPLPHSAWALLGALSLPWLLTRRGRTFGHAPSGTGKLCQQA